MIIKAADFHLCNIAKISHIAFVAQAETLISAFVSSRLNNWRTLFFSSLLESTISELQLVQNARILARTRPFDHIAPVLISLH